MTPRENFIHALERKPGQGRVPHFELAFYLTMEAFGKVHPQHRDYAQWTQMSDKERHLHRVDMAELLLAVAEKYEHSAISIPVLAFQWADHTELFRMIDLLRERSGDRYYLTVNLDGTLGIPSGDEMVDFSMRLVDEPEAILAGADKRTNEICDVAEALARHGGLDGLHMCCDYCMNRGPFLSPAQFGEFVAPFPQRQISAYRELGFYTIKHTDGNILPILDMLVEAGPHALHSLDPQGGVDIAAIKASYGHRICLIGNVNCGLMNSGTREDVIASARYALEKGMPGGGYIFSTSNTIYTGMPLDRYELILDVWRQYGGY